MRRHPTQEDLYKIRQLYADNLLLMVKAYNDGNKVLHNKYVKIERWFDQQEREIMKALSIYIHTPCPVGSSVACDECVGYFYKRIEKTIRKYKNKTRQERITYRRCSPNKKDAIRCALSRREDASKG